METRCDHCRQDCWVEDNQAGEKVVCPRCQRPFTVKRPQERPASFAALLDSVLSAHAVSSAAPAATEETKVTLSSRARRKPRSNARRVWLGMAVMCVAGVVIAVTGAMLIRRALENWRPATGDASNGNYVAWRPDLALLARLGDPKNVDRFKLRLPKSFTALSVLPEPGWLPRNGHFVGLRWTGPAHERAEIYATIVRFPAAAPMRGGLEDALDRFYEWLGYRAGLAELSRGEPELGLLNGRNCIRASFFCRLRRRETLRGVKREGIVYILLDGDRQVTLYTLCDPDLQEDHNLMAASLLTWQEQ